MAPELPSQSPELCSSMHYACRAYTTAADLKEDFASGALHPGDLKPALARQLNAILQPVRDHFERDDRARDLLKQVKVGNMYHLFRQTLNVPVFYVQLPWRTSMAHVAVPEAANLCKPLACALCLLRHSALD